MIVFDRGGDGNPKTACAPVWNIIVPESNASRKDTAIAAEIA
jgi:hypothetical protein